MKTKTVCISIAESPRRRRFQKTAEKLGVDFEFVDATTRQDLLAGLILDNCTIDITDLSWVAHEQHDVRRSTGPLGFGEIGCAYSHIRCWQMGRAEDLDFLVVFEDDAALERALEPKDLSRQRRGHVVPEQSYAQQRGRRDLGVRGRARRLHLVTQWHEEGAEDSRETVHADRPSGARPPRISGKLWPWLNKVSKKRDRPRFSAESPRLEAPCLPKRVWSSTVFRQGVKARGPLLCSEESGINDW